MVCSQIIALGIHLVSWHSQEYNNINPGAYIRTDCNIQVGAYYNSERRLSIYGAYVLETDRFFAFAGAATGYNNRFIIPLGGVGVKLGNFRLSYTPGINRYKTPHLLHLTYEFNFK